MTIAICDDEKVFADKIEKLVVALFELKGIKCDVNKYISGTDLLSSIEKGSVYDVIFMDVNLITEDGINIVANLRDNNSKVPVVFVSSYENRAIEGYDVNAYAFILKKNMEEKMPRLVERLCDTLFRKNTILICRKDSTELVAVSDILYIESEHRQTIVHTVGECLIDKRSIQNFAKTLFKEDFIEVHKSIYVNILKIKRINMDTIELENNISLPLSRRNRKAVMFEVMEKVANR